MDRFFKKRLLVTSRETAADFFLEQAAERDDSRNDLNYVDHPGNCEPSIDGLARLLCLVELFFEQIRVDIGQVVSTVVKRVKLGKFFEITSILRLLSREPGHHDRCDYGEDEAAAAVQNRRVNEDPVSSDQEAVDDNHRYAHRFESIVLFVRAQICGSSFDTFLANATF